MNANTMISTKNATSATQCTFKKTFMGTSVSVHSLLARRNALCVQLACSLLLMKDSDFTWLMKSALETIDCQLTELLQSP